MRPTTRTLIHVNSLVLRRNRRRAPADREAPLTVRRGRKVERAFEVPIRDAAGAVVARVVYRPDRPLSCSAVCWVECLHPVVLEPAPAAPDPPTGADPGPAGHHDLNPRPRDRTRRN